MSKTLVIAEKPSVAADYAKILNCCNRKKGYFEGNNYVVTYAIGHLFTLKEPEEYDPKYKTWNLDDLPIIPDKFKIKLIDKTKEQYYIIKQLVNREDISEIINGGDSGIEGELIQRWILLSTRTKKPIKRLWIHDMTEKSIRSGMNNLRDSADYDRYYYAANTRAKIDWVIGMNYSRAYTKKIGGKNVLFSIGRCQTPILNLIVNRDTEIENFKPVNYYEVVADFQNYSAKYIDLNNTDEGTRIFDKSTADNIVNQINNKCGKVFKLNKEVKNKRPPLLFNLTDLQKVMSNKYGFTEDKTLKLAQKLYEEYKVLSYPRTSSNCLSENLSEEFKSMLSILDFGDFSSIIKNIKVSNIENIKKDKRFVNDNKIEDHYALIPTQNKNIQDIYKKLDDDEKTFFKEIVLRFLSIFYDDYKYETTSILTKVDDLNFICSGTITLNNGWKDIYSDDEKDISNDQNIKNNVKEGDMYNVLSSKAILCKTKEPPCYTTATILSIMQKYNIGTEATRTNIIQTLLKRDYITRDGKKIKSTQLGKDLINSISIDEIKSVELTSNLENKLNDILNEKISSNEVFQDAVSELNKNVEDIKNSNMKVIEDNSDILGKCPLCHTGNIVVKKNFYGCTNYKNGCKFILSKNFLGTKLSDKQIKKILNKGKSDLLKMKGKYGEFKARLTYNTDEKRLKILK